MRKTLAIAISLLSFNAQAIDPNFDTETATLSIPTVSLSESETLHNIELGIIAGRNPLSFELKKFNPAGNSMVRSIVVLSGGAETAPVKTEGAGVGRFKVNLETGGITGFIYIRNLDNATAAHIHQGAIGTDGPVVIGLVGDKHYKFIPKGTILTADQLTAFKARELYINVHSTENPAGEIRGQLPNGNHRFASATLSGASEVPAVTTEANGNAFLRLNLNNGHLRGYIQTIGITVTSAHIHQGKEGATGAPIVTLEIVSTTGDSTLIKVPDNTNVKKEQIKAILNKGAYVNIHSDAFPAGEIRGQLHLRKD